MLLFHLIVSVSCPNKVLNNSEFEQPGFKWTSEHFHDFMMPATEMRFAQTHEF